MTMLPLPPQKKGVWKVYIILQTKHRKSETQGGEVTCTRAVMQELPSLSVSGFIKCVSYMYDPRGNICGG